MSNVQFPGELFCRPRRGRQAPPCWPAPTCLTPNRSPPHHRPCRPATVFASGSWASAWKVLACSRRPFSFAEWSALPLPTSTMAGMSWPKKLSASRSDHASLQGTARCQRY